MPLVDYGVLKGVVGNGKRPRRWSLNPHYTIRMRAEGSRWNAMVNSRAKSPPHEVLYWLSEDYSHPLLDRLAELPDGWTAIRDYNRTLALDYVRDNLFTRSQMRPLPHDLPGANNDLSDCLDSYCGRATSDQEARAYAFGSRFVSRGRRGVHEMHMNQGSDMRHRRADGVWQDGGLFFYYPKQNKWVAVFLAFQHQSFDTDDRTGWPVDA